MLPFAYYLFKVMICSGILFGYYWLVLRNKAFHQYNRFFLLATVVLSLALPALQFNIWHNANEPAPRAIQLLQVVNNSNGFLDEMVVKSRFSFITTELALVVLYACCTLVFLAIFLHSLIKIRTLFIKNQHSLIENIFFINTTAKGTPFSFLKYIFWNDLIDPESPTGHQIFKHELAHVQQKHSHDKLFINGTLIFFWVNPFFWLLRKELNMIHEFMADKIAVEDSNTATFAAMILQATYPQHHFQLTNPFFYSPIKRRLQMLTKNKNPKVGYAGRILVLPLAMLVFAAFTLKAKTFNTKLNDPYHGKKITVVIDAGHGGTDNGAQSIDGNIKEKDITLAIIKKIKELHSNSNINLVFTRESDVFQTVKEKADFTKRQNADLFISIHVDAAGKDAGNSQSGVSVWVARDNFSNAAGSKLFASAIINEFNNDFALPVKSNPQQSETGVKVLQESDCPSVLFEAGYLTNSKDLAFLTTEAAREKIAVKLLSAIENYAFAKEKTATANLQQTTTTAFQPVPAMIIDSVPKNNSKNFEKALIILDDKTISQDQLKKLNPETIESVQVLKDKSATEKYGEKGKYGVVIILSKKKEIVSNDLMVVINDKSSKDTATLNGNIKIQNTNTTEKRPLYVIDGKVQDDKLDINTISPNDIERINVLKDKYAIDKYGVEGTNGVVEIYTKPKTGKKEIPITTTQQNDVLTGSSAVIIPVEVKKVQLTEKTKTTNTLEKQTNQ